MLMIALLLAAAALFGWMLFKDTAPLPASANLWKIVYSGLLILGAVLLVREVDTVWKEVRPGIGTFQFADGGKLDETRAEALRAMILQRHGQINRSFRRENALRAARLERDRAAADLEVAPLPFANASLGFSTDALSELELKVQGINFGKMLSSLRRRVAPPNEITGQVIAGGDRISAVVRWPGAPRIADHRHDDNRLMIFEGVRRDSDLAARVACALIWAELVSDQAGAVTRMRRDHYCMWTEAFLIWQRLRDKRGADLVLSIDDLADLERARDDLKLLIGQSVEFSEIYHLHASLLQLDPNPGPQQPGEIAQSRAIYAAMGAGKSLDEARQTARMAALTVRAAAIRSGAAAAAPIEAIVVMDPADAVPGDFRPMIPLVDGAPVQLAPEGLQEPIQAQAQAVADTALATGFLRLSDGDQPLRGTGFVVARDIVVTADFVPGYGSGGASAAGALDMPLLRMEFSTAEDARADRFAPRLAVASVLSSDPDRGLTFLHVPGLSSLGVAPVTLASAVPAPGAPVAVIGYPARDARVTGAAPPGWQDFVKRLMPGQMLDAPDDRSRYAQTFAHDASTAGGTAGAPVLDLSTGLVVGLHMGGTTLDDGAKRNFAVPLTAADVAAVVSAE